MFRVHWYWKRFSSKDDEGDAIQRELLEILQRQKQKQRTSRLFSGVRSSELGSVSASGEIRPSDSREGCMFDSSRSLAEQPEAPADAEGRSQAPELLSNAQAGTSLEPSDKARV